MSFMLLLSLFQAFFNIIVIVMREKEMLVGTDSGNTETGRQLETVKSPQEKGYSEISKQETVRTSHTVEDEIKFPFIIRTTIVIQSFVLVKVTCNSYTPALMNIISV